MLLVKKAGGRRSWSKGTPWSTRGRILVSIHRLALSQCNIFKVGSCLPMEVTWTSAFRHVTRALLRSTMVTTYIWFVIAHLSIWHYTRERLGEMKYPHHIHSESNTFTVMTCNCKKVFKLERISDLIPRYLIKQNILSWANIVSMLISNLQHKNFQSVRWRVCQRH